MEDYPVSEVAFHLSVDITTGHSGLGGPRESGKRIPTHRRLQEYDTRKLPKPQAEAEFSRNVL